MNTKEGFDLLQLMADNASDWHDAIATGSEIRPPVIVMTSLLNAQRQMFRGRSLNKDPDIALALFHRWAVTYDRLFLTGNSFGIVPNDSEKSDNSLRP